MPVLFQLLPFLTMLAVYAAFFKVGARVLRVSRLTWSHALQFAGLVGVLTIVGRAASLYLGEIPIVLGALLSLALQVTLGAWFFGERALASDGQLLGRAGGAKLTAIAFGLLILVGVVLSVVFLAANSA
jgi:hypothetical protein